MLWWTLRQLKSTSETTRLQAVVKLGRTAGVETRDLLAAALGDTDTTVRRAAAEALKQFGVEAVRPLIAALGDRDKSVRSTAAEALATIGDRRAIGPLIAHLDTPAACKALLRFGPEATEPLLVALAQGKGQDREGASEALARIADPASVPALVAMLAHVDANLRRTALRILERISPGWRESESARGDFPSWCLAVRHPETGGRKPALEALSFLGDPRAAEALIPALTDEGSDVRSLAADVLGRLGDSRAAVSLLGLLGDDYELVRISAAAALDRLQPGWRDTAAGSSAFRTMISDLRNPDPAVRKGAAVSLDSLGWIPVTAKDRALFGAALERWEELHALGEAAIDALLLLLRTSNGSELKPAMETLSAIDPQWTERDAARAAAPALESALARISSPTVMLPVLSALRQIDPQWAQTAEARAAVPGLVSGLNSARKREAEHRIALIEALGEIGDSRAVEALIAALEGDHWRASRCAAEALGKIGDARAIEPLVRRLCSNYSGGDEVAGAIRKLAPLTPSCGPVAEYTVKAVDYRSDGLRVSLQEAEQAVRGLCGIDSPVASNVLHLVAQLQDLSIQWSAYCAGEKLEVSREPLRKIAREELARRGNPRYRPEAFLKT